MIIETNIGTEKFVCFRLMNNFEYKSVDINTAVDCLKKIKKGLLRGSKTEFPALLNRTIYFFGDFLR